MEDKTCRFRVFWIVTHEYGEVDVYLVAASNAESAKTMLIPFVPKSCISSCEELPIQADQYGVVKRLICLSEV